MSASDYTERELALCRVCGERPEIAHLGSCDECEVVDITTFGGDVRYENVGLARAVSRARGRLVADEIGVEEFEAELDRLIAKGYRP